MPQKLQLYIPSQKQNSVYIKLQDKYASSLLQTQQSMHHATYAHWVRSAMPRNNNKPLATEASRLMHCMVFACSAWKSKFSPLSKAY
jgi:hypothetical protein